MVTWNARARRTVAWLLQLGLLLSVGLLLLVGMLSLAACSSGEEAGSTLDRLRERGVVRVGFANEAPYAYLDPATGELTGEAPVVLRELMTRLNVAEVEGVLTEFGSLIPGLQAGRFDLIAAGMYITPPRCQQVAFTDPTYGIGEAFLVRAGNPLDLHAYEDVAAHADARLGVVAGTVELGYARATGVDDDRIVIFPDPPSALAGLQTDRVDAYAGTALTVQTLLTKAGDASDLERAQPFTDPVIDGQTVRGYGAFALRPDDTDLRAVLDTELDAFLGTPRHRELVAPFGFSEQELPGDVTAARLCTPPPS